MVTVWFIILVSNSGHRIELPARYESEKACMAAATELANGHPGSTANCIATNVPAPTR